MFEIAAILILGILAQWLSWRIKIPAILPLIIIGLLMGPVSSAFTSDGHKIIDPDNIFAGKAMYYFVSLAVGVILFEGGLTLKLKEVKHVAGTVRNLLIFGTLIMLFGGAVTAYFVAGLDYDFALLFGALIIVTGPTVIAPILMSVHANKNVGTVLKWEGILIDSIGAVVAVLVYEIFFVGRLLSGEIPFSETILHTLLPTIAVGLIVGFVSARLLFFILKRDLVPHYLMNVVTLASVVLAFAGADVIRHESGLLSVTVMGIVLANLNTPKIKEILAFKESLTVILVSVLFIILAADIDLSQFSLIGYNSLIVLAIVMLVLRPLAVFLSSIKSNLTFKEKLFISWIGPKGIVAAAVASLFSLYIMNFEGISAEDLQQAKQLTPLIFTIILGTVLINGLTAKPLARMLGVVRKPSNGFLLVGANEIAVLIGKYLESKDISVTLIDNSDRNVKYALANDLHALNENVLSEEVLEDLEFEDVGKMLALTSSNDVNIFAIRKFRQLFGVEQVFRLITGNEMKFSTLTRPKSILFGGDADYIKLMGISRKYRKVDELKLENNEHLHKILNEERDEMIPLFIRNEDNVEVITARYEISWKEGDMLAYMGKYVAENFVTDGAGEA